MREGQLLFGAVISILVSVLFLSSDVFANTFPFRSVNLGDQPPELTFLELQSKQVITLDRANSKNVVIVFWGADNDSKKNRVVRTLKVIGKLHSFLNEKNIDLFIVNVGNDSPEIIDGVMTEAGLTLPVYIDTDLKAYGELGIFVVPSILLLNKEGIIAGGMGYSRDLDKRFAGEVEVMIGEKERAAFELELRPETIEKSKEEKSANRHYKLGQTMYQRGQIEAAIKELKLAVEIDPEMTAALIMIGCLYVEIDNIELAREALDKGLAKAPDSVDGQICQAGVKAKEGGVAEAVDDLQFLLLRNSRDANLHHTIARLYVKQGKLADGVREYETAYDLLLKKSMHE